MKQTIYVYFVIGLAIVAANTPFLLPRVGKHRLGMIWRLALLMAMYFLVGAIGFALEVNLGKTTGQGWEFYAITLALFISFAFPGFVYRQLLRHK